MQLLLLFFLPFAAVATPEDSIARYHEPLDGILPDFYYYRHIYDDRADSANTMKSSGVASYSENDQTYEFDRSGQLVRYTYPWTRKRMRRKHGRYHEKLEVKYDRQGRLTGMEYLQVTVAYSKGEYVFKTAEKLQLAWNDAERTCIYKSKGGKSGNVAYVGDDEDDWDVYGTYTFDEKGKPVSYTGTMYGRKGNERYVYDTSGRLLLREITFTGTADGFRDSIVYIDEPGAGSKALHYFIAVAGGRTVSAALIEIIRYDSRGHVADHEMTAATPLIVGEKDFREAKKYTAVWSEERLLQEDWFDVNGKNFHRNLYAHGLWEGGYSRTCTQLKLDTLIRTGSGYRSGRWIGDVYHPADTTHGDTCFSFPGVLSIYTSYFNPHGLLLKQARKDYIDYYYGEVPLFREKTAEYTETYNYRFYGP